MVICCSSLSLISGVTRIVLRVRGTRPPGTRPAVCGAAEGVFSYQTDSGWQSRYFPAMNSATTPA